MSESFTIQRKTSQSLLEEWDWPTSWISFTRCRLMIRIIPCHSWGRGRGPCLERCRKASERIRWERTKWVTVTEGGKESRPYRARNYLLYCPLKTSWMSKGVAVGKDSIICTTLRKPQIPDRRSIRMRAMMRRQSFLNKRWAKIWCLSTLKWNHGRSQINNVTTITWPP